MDQKVIEAASNDHWIIDGNYTRTLDFRCERASSIIFIDFNRFLCIYRVFKRWLKNRGKTRFDLAEDCPEKIDLAFLSWIWHYPKRSRGRTLEKINDFRKENKVVHLKKPKDVRSFLKDVESSFGAGKGELI